MRYFKSIVLSLLLAGSFCACVSVPITGKKAFILTSPEQEAELGRQAYREVLGKEGVSGNPHWQRLLDQVAQRLLAVAPTNQDQWEFTVTQGSEKNAFALPGGKVGVTRGMMEFLDTEAELAPVVSHEIAHVLARHPGQRISMALGTQLGIEALRVIANGPMTTKKRVLFGALGAGAAFGAMLPFSRGHESEADEIGLRFMAKGGYLPDAAVELWQKMAKQERRIPEFLSTHPSSDRRMKALRSQLADVMPLYQNSPRYGQSVSLSRIAE